FFDSHSIVLYHVLLTLFLFFFFNDPATTEIYTLSLHDALPILRELFTLAVSRDIYAGAPAIYVNYLDYDVMSHAYGPRHGRARRSEEHTSELQSRGHLVCRLLLEKKKKNKRN